MPALEQRYVAKCLQVLFPVIEADDAYASQMLGYLEALNGGMPIKSVPKSSSDPTVCRRDDSCGSLSPDSGTSVV